MNILFLEQYSQISGGQLCLLEMLAELDRREFTPFVAVPGAGELTERLNRLSVPYFILPVGTYSVGRKNLYDAAKMLGRSFLLIPETVRLLRKHRIDLVYANAPRTFLWGTLAARLADIPVIWHLHLILKGRMEKFLAGVLLRLGVKRVVCVSRAVAASLDPLGKHRDKITVIHNGVDLQQFKPGNSPEKFREEYNIPPNFKIVSILGQVSAAKGHRTFVRAAEKIVAECPDTVFFIVGGPSYEASGQEFVDSLKLWVRERNLDRNIIFTGKRCDIPAVLAATDIVVVASEIPEACCRVIIEAFAAGKPVVASDTGGTPELVTDREDGMLFTPGDWRELSRILSDMLKDPAGLRQMGVNARMKAERLFDLKCSSHQIMAAVKAAGLSKRVKRNWGKW